MKRWQGLPRRAVFTISPGQLFAADVEIGREAEKRLRLLGYPREGDASSLKL